MITAYICSPFRANTATELKRNIQYAQMLTRKAIEAELAPITPHLYITQVVRDDIEQERQQGLKAGLALLDCCEILILGKYYGISDGMRAEIEKARKNNIKIVTEKELEEEIKLLRNRKRGQQ